MSERKTEIEREGGNVLERLRERGRGGMSKRG